MSRVEMALAAVIFLVAAVTVINTYLIVRHIDRYLGHYHVRNNRGESEVKDRGDYD